MLSQDPTIEAAGVDSQFVSHQEAEACRVQVGAAADDAVFGKAAQFPGHISQHINCWRVLTLRGWSLFVRKNEQVCARLTWVGNHDDDAVGAVPDDLRDDVFKDVDVPLDKVQPALSLLLTDSCRHHHDAGVCCHRVVWETTGKKKRFVITFKKFWDLDFYRNKGIHIYCF